MVLNSCFKVFEVVLFVAYVLLSNFVPKITQLLAKAASLCNTRCNRFVSVVDAYG